jgi:hypothetical protein
LTLFLVLLVLLGIAWYSTAYGNWPWQGEPKHISYCGRDYVKVDGPPRVLGHIGFPGDPPVEPHSFRVPPLVGREVIPAPVDCGVRHGPYTLFHSTGDGDYREYLAR